METFDDPPWQDDKGTSSVRPALELFQIQHWKKKRKNSQETGWSAYELSWAPRYNIELNWTELDGTGFSARSVAGNAWNGLTHVPAVFVSRSMKRMTSLVSNNYRTSAETLLTLCSLGKHVLCCDRCSNVRHAIQRSVKKEKVRKEKKIGKLFCFCDDCSSFFFAIRVSIFTCLTSSISFSVLT